MIGDIDGDNTISPSGNWCYIYNYMNNNNLGMPRYEDRRGHGFAHVSTGVDTSGRRPDTENQWLSIDSAFDYLAAHGLMRSKKTLRRRCLNGGFNDSRKKDTPNGFKYEVTIASLETYLEEELSRENGQENSVNTRVATSGHDRTGVDMSGRVQVNKNNDSGDVDTSGQAQERPDVSSQSEELLRLRKENEELKEANQKLFVEKEAAHQTRAAFQSEFQNLQERAMSYRERIGELRKEIFMLKPGAKPEHTNGENGEQDIRVHHVE